MRMEVEVRNLKVGDVTLSGRTVKAVGNVDDDPDSLVLTLTTGEDYRPLGDVDKYGPPVWTPEATLTINRPD